MKLSKLKKQPKYGDYRIAVKFAWLPKKVFHSKDEYSWIWFEKYYRLQYYNDSSWNCRKEFPSYASLDIIMELNKKFSLNLTLPSKLQGFFFL